MRLRELPPKRPQVRRPHGGCRRVATLSDARSWGHAARPSISRRRFSITLSDMNGWIETDLEGQNLGQETSEDGRTFAGRVRCVIARTRPSGTGNGHAGGQHRAKAIGTDSPHLERYQLGAYADPSPALLRAELLRGHEDGSESQTCPASSFRCEVLGSLEKRTP